MSNQSSFHILGPATPARPVVLSVPHAGRDYPPALLAAARLSPARLATLEDRHADLLALGAADAGFTVIVARRARAWIDLNRAPRELDPELVQSRPRGVLERTSRVASGLGLIPRRLAGSGDIWARRLPLEDVEGRIAHDYRPYHARLAAVLDAARARHGAAVLLDLHSMPPCGGASIVVGDLYGRSADRRFALTLRDTAEHAGLSVDDNVPYAGGHIVNSHGEPGRGIHALQLEICRSLYLDADHREPGPGLPRIRAFVRDAAEALEYALSGARAIAAE